MEQRRSTNKTIHSEGREIIRRVIEKCDEESRSGVLTCNIKQSTLRVQNYTGFSKNTILKIRKSSREAGDERLKTPGKKRKRADHRNCNIDSFDKRVIRDVISNFYIVQKRVPSCIKLLAAIRERIDFPWGRQTLRRLLHKMGFRWKKCASFRKVLIERPDIVNWRCKYLQTIKRYRQENRNIVYMDETWVDNNLTFKKCWQSSEVNGILTNTSSSNRLIVVHAGGKNGFVKNSLLVFKAGLTTGDYHGQMCSSTFEKWVNEKLIPNIPPKSVIVFDNAPYHCIQENKAPTKYSLKKDMQSWLQSNNVPFDEKMRKADLMELINQHKPREKIFRVDEEVKRKGHDVLRLPPYNCDLSPIELAWAEVKRQIREKNITSDLSLNGLKEALTIAVSSVSKDAWVKYCEHVDNLEKAYWTNDGIMEAAMEDFIISVDDNSSDSDNISENESVSSMGSDQSELAVPLE